LNFERTLIMKKKFNKVVSLALASVMAMGLFTTVNLGSLSAKAENEDASANSTTTISEAVIGNGKGGTVEDPAKEIVVTKTVTVDKAGTLLPTEDFIVTMVPATADQLVETVNVTDEKGNTVYEADGTTPKTTTKAVTDANGMTIEAGPALAHDNLTFSFSASNSTTSGEASLDRSFKLTFADQDEAFDHSGIYRYYITEEIPDGIDASNKYSNGYITYDPTTYIVDLYVDANSKGVYVPYTYALQEVGKTEKPQDVTFTNNIDCSTLVIKKKVEGTEYKTGEYYTFRILIPEGGDTLTLAEGYEFKAKIMDATGNQVKDDRTKNTDGYVILKVNGKDIDAEMETYASEFQLKKGEYLELDGAPVTMIFKVEEVVDSKEGYTTNITYKELGDFANNAKHTTQPSKEDNYTQEFENTTSVKGTVNTDSTNVTFTNVRNLDANTGLNIDFLPYALVLIVAVCGSILFIIAKKRKQ
jgi:hypothetical protein